MRLSDDKIKAGILHPHRDVRSEAVLHFSRSFTRDDSILPVAIRAVAQYGWDRAFVVSHCMEGLPLNDATLPWVLAQLQHDDAKKPNPFGWPARWHTLNSLLSNADPHLLSRHQQAILDFKGLDAEVRSIISRRIAMLSRDSDTGWRELEKFCFLAKDVEDISEVDLDYAFALMEAVVRQKDQYAEKVMSTLAEKIEDLQSNPIVWMEAFAARMAGEMRLEPAIPFIIAKMKEVGEEAEWLIEQCESALVKIGGDTTIRAVADLFREEDWHRRMAACHVLEHIHSDLAVTTALDFLPNEDDGAIRAYLAGGLASHCAFEAVEPLRQMVIDGSYDETHGDVKRDLVIAAKLMSLEFPELEYWGLEVEKKRLEIETKLLEDESQRLLLEKKRLQRELRTLKAKNRSSLRQVAEKNGRSHEEPPPPLKKKVGRNDICPCGSGKKFKKCCIKKLSHYALD
jgi:hypothetical protein